MERLERQNGLVPNPNLVIKNQKGYFGYKEKVSPTMRVSNPIPALHPPRVSVPRRKVPITSGCKNKLGLWLSEWEGSWSPMLFTCKAHVQTYLDLLVLSSSASTAAGKAPGIRGEEMNHLTSR